MSLSSTSNSKLSGWRRVRREVLRLIFVLLALELFVRIPPVAQALEDRLALFELILRYDRYLPGYERELRGEYGGGQNMWMLGSSYMMTSLNPEWIQNHLNESDLGSDITVQNYGLTRLRSLELMGQVIETDLFPIRQPRYALIGTGALNFVDGAFRRAAIQDSPYEEVFILPDTLDDYVAAFLYRNIHLYRYTVLLRNYLLFDESQVLEPFLPLGGYAERHRSSQCDFVRDDSQQTPPADLDFEKGIAQLDSFIDMLESHNIPVMVVNVPLPACTMYDTYGYGNFANYQRHYLTPLAEHLEQKGIPFYPMDFRFFETVPEAEHGAYYDDPHHPNKVGAELFSAWTAEYIADWVQNGLSG